MDKLTIDLREVPEERWTTYTDEDGNTLPSEPVRLMSEFADTLVSDQKRPWFEVWYIYPPEYKGKSTTRRNFDVIEYSDGLLYQADELNT